jgi:hypothetical protein
MSVFSAGVIGWIVWKVGALDVAFYFVIQLALLFPLALFLGGALSPDVYNGMVDKMNNTVTLINNAAASAVAKGQSLKSVRVNLKSV